MSEVIEQSVGTTPNTEGAQAAVTTAPAEVKSTEGAQVAATSQPATEGQPVTPAAGTEGNQATEVKTSTVPDKYEFKAPEGASLDEAVIAEFSTVAKEAGLSQEAAQKFIDKLVPKLAERTTAAQAEAFNAQKTEWLNQSRTDKEFGGDKLNENVAIAAKAIDTFGTPALRKLLDDTGLGNHPEFIRAFYKAGKAIKEDSKPLTGGKAPPSEKRSAADILYGNKS
jgi:hypothetical protein